MGNYRMVMVFKSGTPKGAEKDATIKALKGLTWDWETNAKVKFKENISCGLSAPFGYREEKKYEFKNNNSFFVEERGRWAECKCLSQTCGVEFNFPIPSKKCIICDGDDLEYQGRGVGKLVVNAKERASTWALNEDNLQAAREDLSKNPPPSATEGYDWSGLKKTMDNTDYTGGAIDPSSD